MDEVGAPAHSGCNGAAAAGAAPGDAISPGSILRRARLAQRLTLQHVAAATRIRAAYLQAIEDNDYSLLPAAPHARAFVQSYARYLVAHEATRDLRAGTPAAPVPLDPEALVAMYERQRRPRTPRRVVRAGRRRRLSAIRVAGTGAVLILGVLVVALLLNPSWLQLRPLLATLPGVEPRATPTTLGGGLTGAGLDSPRPASEAVGGTVATPGPGVVVRAAATEGVWVRVTIDGQLAQEGLLALGEQAVWSGKRSVHIRSGNARALSLVVNGENLGPLGTEDEVIERTFVSPAERG